MCTDAGCWPHADGRLLQSHRCLQELSSLRGVDYLHSAVLTPEIGPQLAGLDAWKTKIDEVAFTASNADLHWLGVPA